MGRRRVRWRNVGRVACLAAAAALILTHRSEPRPAAPVPATSSPRPRPAVRAPEVRPLPRLHDIPRLRLPRPRRRRASKERDSDGKGGPRTVVRPYDAKVTKGARPARNSPPSPPPGGAGQLETNERSALPPMPPSTGEFTPDPA